MEPDSNKKRRLRPSKTATGKPVKEIEQSNLESPKVKVAKERNAILKTLGTILRPLTWLLKHIIPRYFRNSFAELRLVTWPNRKQSRQLTTAVVLFSIVFGFLVAILDYGLDKIFKKVFLKG